MKNSVTHSSLQTTKTRRPIHVWWMSPRHGVGYLPSVSGGNYSPLNNVWIQFITLSTISLYSLVLIRHPSLIYLLWFCFYSFILLNPLSYAFTYTSTHWLSLVDIFCLRYNIPTSKVSDTDWKTIRSGYFKNVTQVFPTARLCGDP